MKWLILIPLFSVSLALRGQDAAPKIPSVPLREDQLIICLTSDNWSGLPSDIEDKPFRSRGFSLFLLTDRMHSSGRFGAGAGIGFISQNVHTDAVIADTGKSAALIVVPDSAGLITNKLSSNFIAALIELRLRTNENKSGQRFKLSAGFVAALMVQSHTKYEDKNGKLKYYNVPFLNKFQYGLEARLGYGNLGVYAYYALSEVFKSGKGPELTPFSAGLFLTL